MPAAVVIALTRCRALKERLSDMTEELRVSATSPDLHRSKSAWLTAGVANTAVVLLLSVVSWWLLIDPVTNVIGWNIYPEPFTSWLFWCLIIVIFIGFNMQFHGFSNLRQPLRGLALMGISVGISVLITVVLAKFVGAFSPSFSSDRPAGAGYATGAQWVLFAYLVYVMSVVNWGHWPWTGSRLSQTRKGFAEVIVLLIPTTILYVVFALPNFLIDGPEPLFGPTETLGYFYCCILSVVATGNLTDNWPWRLAGTPARTALASTIGNLLLGGLIYAALLQIVPLLIGGDNASAMSDVTATLPAQFGVCWVMWMILWPNVFDNYPTRETLSNGVKYGIRVLVTFVLGAITFLGYYFFVAGPVLHEPAVGSNLAGSALGFLDWCILWALWYVLCFESLGIRRFFGSSTP